jgi:hypothetical protein
MPVAVIERKLNGEYKQVAWMKRVLGVGQFRSTGSFAGAVGMLLAHPLREEAISCKSATG